MLVTITDFYLACTACGKWTSPSCETAEECFEAAFKLGWTRKEVQNGSVWDYCPKCAARLAHGVKAAEGADRR